jgi:hypothetical protein
MYDGVEIVIWLSPQPNDATEKLFCRNQKRWEVTGGLNKLPKNAFNYFVLSLDVIICNKMISLYLI